MKSTRRQPKIPNHFQDSIHDLNKKKDVMKNKATGVKVSKVVDCLDKANKECLDEDVNQGCMFDNVMDSQKNDRGNLVDSVGMENELKDNGLDIGEGVDVSIGNVDSVMFGSVNDDILKENGGSPNVKLPTVSQFKPEITDNPKMSYASAANKLDSFIVNKLMTIPTDVDELGNEFVVFDEMEPKEKGNYSNNTMKENISDVVKENNVIHKENVNEETPKKGKEGKEKPVGSVAKEVNISGNKFSVLEDLDDEEEMYEIEGSKNSANKKKKTNLNSKEDWKHEIQKDNDGISIEMEDGYSMNDGMACEMNKGDLKGMDGNVLQDC
ncbi:hypothetical protein Tco_1504078 [Tanacetum coccineum]